MILCGIVTKLDQEYGTEIDSMYMDGTLLIYWKYVLIYFLLQLRKAHQKKPPSLLWEAKMQ